MRVIESTASAQLASHAKASLLAISSRLHYSDALNEDTCRNQWIVVTTNMSHFDYKPNKHSE
jgi:hypothetical protein